MYNDIYNGIFMMVLFNDVVFFPEQYRLPPPNKVLLYVVLLASNQMTRLVDIHSSCVAITTKSHIWPGTCLHFNHQGNSNGSTSYIAHPQRRNVPMRVFYIAKRVHMASLELPGVYISQKWPQPFSFAITPEKNRLR